MSQLIEIKKDSRSRLERLGDKAKDLLQLDGIYGEIARVLGEVRDEYFEDEDLNAQIEWKSGALDGCVVLTWASADKTWKSAYNKRISVTFNALKSQMSVRLGGEFSDDLGFNQIIDIVSSGDRASDLLEFRNVLSRVLEAQNQKNTPQEYDCNLWYAERKILIIRGAQ